ncbi:MAG: tetratricopeptide repeat protein, partial [Thermoplasmata archaeon]
MPGPTFTELVGELLETLGQNLSAVRTVPEGMELRTSDAFLYAFVEEPNRLSLTAVRRWIEEAPGGGRRLVVFCRERLPLALSAELTRASATTVEGSRFHDLARSLGLGAYLGEEPRPAAMERPRLLPSSRLLDERMSRARTWQDWGVPALALRFYRQAAELKPGFLPARVGIAHALIALGLLPEAEAELADVLAA